MRKKAVLILSAVMTLSLLAAAVPVSAAGAVKVKIIMIGRDPVMQTVTSESVSIVKLTQNGENAVATTVGGTDQWVSVSLPDIDTNVYDSFVIKYKASGTAYHNGIYLKGRKFNTSYSATEGTYAAHNFISDGNWHTNEYSIQSSFPAMMTYPLTGVRIPVCSEAGDTFEIESITFKSSAYYESTDEIPAQSGKVFGGWYTDTTFTETASSAPAYAKFVDKNVHKVKWQIKNGAPGQSGTADIRFVTTIDSLDYRNAGFEITYEGKTVSVSTKKAFKQLKAGGEDISPSAFSAQSQYFVTFVLTDVPAAALDRSFTATAFWTTPEGIVVKGDALTFCVNEPDGATARVVSPGTGRTVSLLTDEMTNWVNNFRPAELNDICDCTEKCEPLPVVLKWDEDNSALYTHVLLSKNEDMSDPDVYLCIENSLRLEDLFAGQTYYWQLRKEYADKVVLSKINSFDTLQAPRTVSLDGVSNVRDIGGYYSADGRYRIKQGIVYRGADFAHLTDEGRNKAVNILGIKTELDLRGTADTKSSLGNTVKYVNVAAPWYTGVWNDAATYPGLIPALRVFTDANNFPVYFHCSLGRDRTGTVAFFLEALCGLSENDIIMDYEVSFFSDFGGYEGSVIPSNMTNDGLRATFYRLRQETGIQSLYEAARAYLKSKGMTDAELDAIRANLLTEVH